jgi:hypothetical protein
LSLSPNCQHPATHGHDTRPTRPCNASVIEGEKILFLLFVGTVSLWSGEKPPCNFKTKHDKTKIYQNQLIKPLTRDTIAWGPGFESAWIMSESVNPIDSIHAAFRIDMTWYRPGPVWSC